MIGQVKDELGMLFGGKNYKIVKKSGNAGDKIDRHNHPMNDIVFTVVSGKFKVCLEGEEEHEVSQGQVLCFDGKNYISAEFLEDDSEVVIALIFK